MCIRGTVHYVHHVLNRGTAPRADRLNIARGGGGVTWRGDGIDRTWPRPACSWVALGWGPRADAPTNCAVPVRDGRSHERQGLSLTHAPRNQSQLFFCRLDNLPPRLERIQAPPGLDLCESLPFGCMCECDSIMPRRGQELVILAAETRWLSLIVGCDYRPRTLPLPNHRRMAQVTDTEEILGSGCSLDTHEM
jgi:hypothetical protein